MTGEKNRYSSVEKLWKLNDETLKTPKHDEMVLWLFNSENVRKVIPIIDNFLSESNSEYIVNFLQFNEDILTPFYWLFVNERIEFFEKLREKKEKLSEEEVNLIIKGYARNGYSINEEGAFKKWKELIQEFNSCALFKRNINIFSEIPIMTSKDFLVGYWDIVIYLNLKKETERKNFSFKWNNNESYPSKLYIEVKPQIQSFGATLRQIRTYQQYERESIGSTYLFTNDIKFKDAFESQGIKVISEEATKEEIMV